MSDSSELLDKNQKYHLDREKFKSLNIDDKIEKLLFLKKRDDFIPFQKDIMWMAALIRRDVSILSDELQKKYSK